MNQPTLAGDFAYGVPASAAAGLPISLSIFADRSALRAQIRDDAQAAGLRVTCVADLAELLEGAARPLGDVVLLDCPRVDAAAMAALCRLDVRAANSGAQLVVSTSIVALDDVFACLDQSGAVLLVDPTRADRVIALGQVLSRHPAGRLRELSEEDRLLLLRMTEQIGKLAERIDRIGGDAPRPAPAVPDSAFRFDPAPASPAADISHGAPAGESDGSARLVRASRQALPDPRLVRRIIRQRQLRARFLDGDLFADPAWDMLLDLTAARAEHARVSVTSLCIASGVPPTTALRWIGQLTEAGLFERIEDDTDRRRAFIALTDKAADAMARYFAEIGSGSAQLA